MVLKVTFVQFKSMVFADSDPKIVYDLRGGGRVDYVFVPSGAPGHFDIQNGLLYQLADAVEEQDFLDYFNQNSVFFKVDQVIP